MVGGNIRLVFIDKADHAEDTTFEGEMMSNVINFAIMYPDGHPVAVFFVRVVLIILISTVEYVSSG